MEDKLYWIWLSLSFPYGSDKPNEILSRYEGPEDFYRLSADDMLELEFLSDKDVKSLKGTSLLRAKKVIKDCEALDIGIAAMTDKLYPGRLRLIYGPPVVIYYRGDISDIDENVAIAIVGTRHATEQTRKTTTWIASDLARAGAIVVSGCAVGIDESAHFGALKGKGRTIGVMACGLDVDYPPENKLLREEIIHRGGGLISELPPKSPVISKYIPTRNRLMAGLSLGVLVTHAPVRSGALITAEHALEQGKEVYCVPPYDVMDLKAMGVMKYIRDGSTVVACAEDILIDFYYGYADKLEKSKIIGDYVAQKKLEGKQQKIQTVKGNPNADKPAVSDLTKEAAAALLLEQNEKNKDIIGEFDEQQVKVYSSLDIAPRFIDEISGLACLNVGIVLSVLTELEILGIVSSYGGKRYSLAT